MSLKILQKLLVPIVTVSAVAGAVLVLAQEPPPPPEPTEVVSAGYDLFTTDPSQTDLLGIPFEGDAGVRPTFDFEPPPPSADGRRAIGDTDTIVHRRQDAFVTEVPGTADPIPIELVLLRLVSRDQFDLDGDGMLDDRIFVTLQKDRNPAGEVRLDFDVPPPADGEPPPPPGPIAETVVPGLRSYGEMTITFASGAGGTFDSFLEIFADLRRGSATGPIVCGAAIGLPPCAALDAGLVLQSDDSAWGREAVPQSITIRGVNFSLAAPNRNDPVDSSTDFWAGIEPLTGQTVCVSHGGHPDPGGLPTRHGTCRTICTPQAFSPDSCRNGKDDDCNGTIDDCDEDFFGPSVTAPADRTFECSQQDPNIHPSVTGFATATDNCFPPTVPASSIEKDDFRTEGCGRTFLVDRIWTATDNCGNAASMPDLQQIRVADTTPPDILCPEARTILWTDDRSTDSLGNASGSDECNDTRDEVGIAFTDVSIPGVCRSEEVTRTFTATDDCGLETPCDQQISVRGPKDSIEDLEALVTSLGLPQGQENRLASILQAGVARVCSNDSIPAVNQLEAFIRQVRSERSIDPAAELRLIVAAQAIIAAIEDPENGGACPEGCGDDGGGHDGGGGGEDQCPDSDTRDTVVIDGCDTGVANTDTGSGCTILDLIAQCAAAANGKDGKFRSCVAKLDFGSDNGAIQSCAAMADLPLD